MRRRPTPRCVRWPSGDRIARPTCKEFPDARATTDRPRFAVGRTDRPYFHLLGGARIDKVSGSSSTSWGGAGGLGIDLGTGYHASVQIRLGADFEIFFHEGENLKALRLTAGFTF